MLNDIEWVIVGSRRWARVIASEICRLQAAPGLVKIFNDAKDPKLVQWVEDSQYKDNLKIIDRIDVCPDSKTGVAVIANSAYLHAASIEQALTAGYHVISEKPMTLSLAETLFLLDKAKKLGLELFSTNTYFFADYFKVLKHSYLSNKKISKIDIYWADPTSEFRYGEEKSYDSGVPLIYDVLPHIVVIILATYGNFKINKSDLKVFRGGSKVKINCVSDELAISISLERNALKRKRMIHFSGEDLDVAFDFTQEPGQVLSDDNKFVVSIHDWELGRKPLAEMIYSLKKYFGEGIQDERLSSNAAALANKLIDLVADDYVEQVMCFSASSKQQDIEESLDFAYTEKEVKSLKKRVLPHLPTQSPLRRLALNHGNNLAISQPKSEN